MQIKWTASARVDLVGDISYLIGGDKALAVKVDVSPCSPQKGEQDVYCPYRMKESLIEILSVFHVKRQLPKLSESDTYWVKRVGQTFYFDFFQQLY